MDKNRIKTIVYALIASLIWGLAFAFQRMAAGDIGPFSFNFYRSVLAAVSLGAVVMLRRRGRRRERAPGKGRRLLMGGLICGALLFVASNLQQKGLEGTEAGKAGFITSLYIVLVPLLGVLFFKKRVGVVLWVSVAMAAAGLYLICIREGFSLTASDRLVLLCAVTYAVYILAVDRLVQGLDAVELSCVHFAVAAVLSGAAAFLLENPSWSALRTHLVSVLYVGVLSSAVAYTLQFAAQQRGNPVTVTLLLSMESVFSVLGAAVLLREFLTPRELLGCAVILLAVALAQLPERRGQT